MYLLVNHAQVLSVRAFVKRCRKMTAFFNKSSQASENMQLFKDSLSLFGEGALQPAARSSLVKEGATTTPRNPTFPRFVHPSYPSEKHGRSP
mmetsp:Transcript_51690/g.70446  ORF Transcript_51690/g.70446 Transcript_51690/m.70446 type:complete len:92 (-) Transcript_51690:824-1099(-)